MTRIKRLITENVALKEEIENLKERLKTAADVSLSNADRLPDELCVHIVEVRKAEIKQKTSVGFVTIGITSFAELSETCPRHRWCAYENRMPLAYCLNHCKEFKEKERETE